MDDPSASYRSLSHTQVIRKFKRTSVPRDRRRAYLGISLLAGILMWAGIDLRRMEDAVIDVEIEFQRQLPADWTFVAPLENAAKVTVRGSRRQLTAIQEVNLMIQPELSAEALSGDMYKGKVALLPSQVSGLPPGVEIRGISPAAIDVNLARVTTRYIGVEAGDITGEPAPGYVVGAVRRPDPPATAVTGPKQILDKITPADVVRTKAFDVQDGKGVVGGMVGLEPFVKDGETMLPMGQVYLSVELVEIPAVREFEQQLDVKAMIDSPFDRYAGLILSPPAVRVAISGPQSLVDKVNPGEIIVYADIRDRVPAAPGEFNIKCRTIAPPRIQVTKIEPDTVKWIAREAPLPEGEGTAEARPAASNG
ncbi:MAG: hypothetical protein LBT97_07510 [Planctomycetota bacterium]|jgi:hypothetical protein|nr:hypothetical protein [Planctomycetota bacterium]